MALFNVSVWQRSRFTLQWFIINLVGSLAWLSAVALAQFEWSEGVSGSVFIPDVALTCLGNLAVFMTAFTRGRLDMENGARDVLATTRGPKLNAVEVPGEAPGCVLTTRPPDDLRDVDVVMLSKYNERPHSSLTQFMQYISHTHALESILLQFSPVTSAPVNAERCTCDSYSACHCVVFWATEEIMNMLDHRLPRTLKRLSESQCLLPSLHCLQNGCHGCNQGLLYVGDLRDVEAADESSELGTSEERLRYGNPRVDSPAAICEALNESLIKEEGSSCICIPLHPRNADRWTKFMIKFLKSKEKEAKGIKVVVSDALQNYITHSTQEFGSIVVREIYDSASLILPRVAEVIVNMGLTGWLRVDGFSSSLVARRAIREYVVDSAGTGFGANAFLTEAVVCCSADGTNVCQVLWFRGGILSARRVSYMVGCVNLICSITWSVLIACEGNWAPSTPLSTPTLAVIIGAVCVALIMDCFEILGAVVVAQFQAWVEAQDQVMAPDRFRELDNHMDLNLPRPQALDPAQVETLPLPLPQALDPAHVETRFHALPWSLIRLPALALAPIRAWVRAWLPDWFLALLSGRFRELDNHMDLNLPRPQALDPAQVETLPRPQALDPAQVETLPQPQALDPAQVETRFHALPWSLIRLPALALAPVRAWVRAGLPGWFLALLFIMPETGVAIIMLGFLVGLLVEEQARFSALPQTLGRPSLPRAPFRALYQPSLPRARLRPLFRPWFHALDRPWLHALDRPWFHALDRAMDPLDLARAQVQALCWPEAKPEARRHPLARTSVLGLMAFLVLEGGCFLSLVVCFVSPVVRLSMTKALGRWVYSGMQVLVWVKWGIGSFLLGDNATEDEGFSVRIENEIFSVRIGNIGTWVYCSAFLLNAMLAGVRGKWVYSK